jgi:hypothetical protein
MADDIDGDPRPTSWAQRRTYIISRARELAKSGSYRSWETVALHLIADGYDDAREMLGEPALRDELDGYCRRGAGRS